MEDGQDSGKCPCRKDSMPEQQVNLSISKNGK